MSEPALHDKWEKSMGENFGMPETANEDFFSRAGNRSDVFVEEFHGAAQIIGVGPSLYDQLWDSDKYFECRKLGGPYYPFAGQVEWEVVQWLNSLDVPMEKIDQFFDLSYVSLMQLPSVNQF